MHWSGLPALLVDLGVPLGDGVLIRTEEVVRIECQKVSNPLKIGLIICPCFQIRKPLCQNLSQPTTMIGAM
jgi:hypothetical protein